MDERQQRERQLREEILSRFPENTLLAVKFVWQIAGDEQSEAANPNTLDVRLIPQGPAEYNAHASEMPSRGKIPEHVYNRVVDEFWQAHEAAIAQFGKDLKGRVPERVRISVAYGGYSKGSVIVEPRLTPVMARLDTTDLETLDALIAAGCAPNRADAIRWALARVRERPAYRKLVDRLREIQALKSEL
jgi:hypothetical protein